jgi:hypothetical protein
MSSPTPEPREFAVRIAAIDDLFAEFDARPVAERPLRDAVRLWLLDEWERVRQTRPSILHVHAPATERVAADESGVGVAVRADLRAHTRRLHYANPLNRRERIAVWAGVVIFLITIALATLLDRDFTGVLIVGISQGIVVFGWVALWDPAQRVAGDIVPHYFVRKRYAELAEIEVRFVWHEPPGSSPSMDSPREVARDGKPT